HTHSPRRLSRVTNSRVVAADSQENCLLRCSKTSNGEVPASRLELSPGTDPDKGSGACSRPRSPNGGFTGLSVINHTPITLKLRQSRARLLEARSYVGSNRAHLLAESLYAVVMVY